MAEITNIKEAPVENKHSFEKGYSQLMKKDIRSAKQDLMDCLHIVANNTFYRRLAGDVEPKETEIVAIEKVFKKYGIDNKKVWGQQL